MQSLRRAPDSIWFNVMRFGLIPSGLVRFSDSVRMRSVVFARWDLKPYHNTSSSFCLQKLIWKERCRKNCVRFYEMEAIKLALNY